MPKYSVFVRETRERGIETAITWSARRDAEPAEQLDSGDVPHTGRSVNDGILMGVYECIKHSEARGEPLPLEDLHVSVEHVEHITKRDKLVNVRRRTDDHVSLYRGIYEEIMARPRPLP